MCIGTPARLEANELTLIIVIIAVGGTITLISRFVNLLQGIHQTRQIEQSRREIAA